MFRIRRSLTSDAFSQSRPHCLSRTQQRDGRRAFVDLVGNGKRIRTVPIPPFVKVSIDAWTAAAGMPSVDRGVWSEGPLLRRERIVPTQTLESREVAVVGTKRQSVLYR